MKIIGTLVWFVVAVFVSPALCAVAAQSTSLSGVARDEQVLRRCARLSASHVELEKKKFFS